MILLPSLNLKTRLFTLLPYWINTEFPAERFSVFNRASRRPSGDRNIEEEACTKPGFSQLG